MKNSVRPSETVSKIGEARRLLKSDGSGVIVDTVDWFEAQNSGGGNVKK